MTYKGVVKAKSDLEGLAARSPAASLTDPKEQRFSGDVAQLRDLAATSGGAYQSLNSAMEVCVDASLALNVVVAEADSDKAADGRIAGMEIPDARKRCGDPDVFQRVILEDIALAPPPALNRSERLGEE